MGNGMTNITKTHNLPKVLIFQVLLSKGKLNIANYDRRFNCLGQMPPPEISSRNGMNRTLRQGFVRGVVLRHHKYTGGVPGA
jgi:hypothetical protein